MRERKTASVLARRLLLLHRFSGANFIIVVLNILKTALHQNLFSEFKEKVVCSVIFKRYSINVLILLLKQI